MPANLRTSIRFAFLTFLILGFLPFVTATGPGAGVGFLYASMGTTLLPEYFTMSVIDTMKIIVFAIYTASLLIALAFYIRYIEELVDLARS